MYSFYIAERYVQHCREMCTALQKDICNIARRYIKHRIEICDYIVAASRDTRQHTDTFASL